jgi:hypothetical protein
MIERIFRNAYDALFDIETSFIAPDGTYKTPSVEEKSKIEKDIASFHALGRITVLAALGGGVLSSLTYCIPILGTLLGTATLVTTIALAVFSYDLITCALNLESLTSLNVQKIRHVCSKTHPLEAKKRELQNVTMRSAIEKTLILSSLFYFLLAAEQN